MPRAAPRPCTYPGCRQLAEIGARCKQHESQFRKAHDAKRGSASERGYDGRWQQTRIAYLRSHPLCVACEKMGRITPATVIDHIIPHRGDRALFWQSSNWQPLCKPCHDRKTATEDGGGFYQRRGGGGSNPWPRPQ
jgi:5-methylcytosine-specific restriction protein A